MKHNDVLLILNFETLVRAGHVEITGVLLRYGAAPDVANCVNKTPIEEATEEEKTEKKVGIFNLNF